MTESTQNAIAKAIQEQKDEPKQQNQLLREHGDLLIPAFPARKPRDECEKELTDFFRKFKLRTLKENADTDSAIAEEFFGSADIAKKLIDEVSGRRVGGNGAYCGAN